MLSKKTLAIAVSIVALSVSCWASWSRMGGNNAYSIYFDPGSVVHDGDTSKAWAMYDYVQTQNDSPAAQSYRSMKGLLYFRCSERQVGMGDMIYYAGNMGNGDVVDRSRGDIVWKDIAPGTVNEDMMRIACR